MSLNGSQPQLDPGAVGGRATALCRPSGSLCSATCRRHAAAATAPGRQRYVGRVL